MSDQQHDARDSEGTQKAGGLGDDGTIPDAPDGIAVGHSDDESHFEPEEDEDAPGD